MMQRKSIVSEKFLLSVVIPVYNEMETIKEVVNAVRQAPFKKEIIIDDYSLDGTRDYLKGLKEDDLKIHFHERNQGKGAALRTGFAEAEGDVILIQDADLEYDPVDYPVLLDPILRGKADVVYGSRLSGHGPHRVLYFWHSVGNRFLTLLSNIFTNINLSDMETCYKVFTKDALEGVTIRQNRFGFEPEITAKMAQKR